MVFWENFMYHQNTLKIFSSQYLGMFAVYTFGIGIKKSYLGLIFFPHLPMYYVIRHKSICGHSDIITIDIFDMISLLVPFIQVLDSPCITVDCICTIRASSINIVKCWNGRLSLHHYLTFQSHFWEKCCYLVFGKIMNNMLFWVLYIDLYPHTSSLCCMVLLRTSPTSFFSEVLFFFFRSDSWTYLPASGLAF